MTGVSLVKAEKSELALAANPTKYTYYQNASLDRTFSTTNYSTLVLPFALTDEEKKATEDLVNKWISEGLDVSVETMSKEDARKSGAECMFIEKYPDLVTVYKIGNVSKELCGGPHVKNTKEIGHFKIKKEEASSAGVRRIKAIIE